MIPAFDTPVTSEMWSRCDETTGDRSTDSRFRSEAADGAG